MLRHVQIICVVLVLLLLASSIKHVQGADKIIDTTGGTVPFTNNIQSTSCTLTLPNNTVCSYEYDSGPPPSPNEICKIPSYLSQTSGYCDFQVSITNRELSGVYTLQYNMTNTTVGEDTFYVYLVTGGVPSGRLTVVEDENMYLRVYGAFDTDTDKECQVVYPNGTSDILLDSSSKYPSYWGNKDECGFKVEGVSQSDKGTWKLRMSSSDGAYTYANFVVEVTSLDTIITGETNPEVWDFGKQGSLIMPNLQHSQYCELWNPRKELVQQARVCIYTQEIVTDADEGNWTFVFGINGKLSEDRAVQKIIVTKGELRVTVSKSERFANGITLLCQVIPGTVNDCRFTRPDGTFLVPREGLGDADYSYFGDGFSAGDCGLTIHEVQEADKGLWKCSVSDGTTRWSGFLNVSTAFPDLKAEASESPVVVLHGSMLRLSCSANRLLEYCWFQHPSGLPLHFSTKVVDLSEHYLSYVYDDTLQQGVCAVIVPQANSSADTGEWTCHLGTQGNLKEESSVPITVGISETDVISLEKELVVSEESVLLKCYSVPLGIPLDYCRFIRPDGKGFKVDPSNSNTVLGRYKYEGGGIEKGECGLRIQEINEDEDLGKWTCVARLQGRITEGYDVITLTTNGGLSTGAIVGIVVGSVAVLLLIGGITCILVRRRNS